MADFWFLSLRFHFPLVLYLVGPVSGYSHGQYMRCWLDKTHLEQLHLWQIITATNSPVFFTPDRFLSHHCGRWWGEYHKTICCFLFYHRQSFTLVERVQRKGFTLTDGLTNTWNIWSIMIIADLFWKIRVLLILRDYNCMSLDERERNFVFSNQSFITALHIDIWLNTQLQKLKQQALRALGRPRDSGAWFLVWAWFLAHRWARSSCYPAFDSPGLISLSKNQISDNFLVHIFANLECKIEHLYQVESIN